MRLLAPLAAAVCCLAGGARGAEEAEGGDVVDAPTRLSLDACIAMALRDNLDIRYQEAASAKLRHDVASARAAFLPTFTGSVAMNDDDPDARTDTVTLSQGTPWGTSVSATVTRAEDSISTDTNVSLTVTQPLLRNAGPSQAMATLRKAHVARDAAELRLRRKLQDVVYVVKQQYYEVAAQRETVKVREQAVERAERLLEEARTKVELGAKTALDSSNAEIQLADRKADLVSAQQRLADALDNLKETLHVPFEREVAIVPVDLDLDPEPDPELGQRRDLVIDDRAGTVEVRVLSMGRTAAGDAKPVVAERKEIFRPQPRDLERTIAVTMESRPDLLAARLDLEAKELECARKRSQARHDLDLSATYTDSGDETQRPGELTAGAWTATLSLELPIGRVSRKSDYEKAALDVEMQEIVVEKIEIGIRKEIRRLFGKLKETELNILAFAKKINAAATALEAARGREELGVSIWELTARQSDLINAQTSFITAYLDYQKRLAELDRACGKSIIAPPLPSDDGAAAEAVEDAPPE